MASPEGTTIACKNVLAQRGIAYVHFIEVLTGRSRAGVANFDFAEAQKALSAAGVAYIANNQFDQAMASAAIESGAADAVAFGVPCISNPDLPARFATGAALNAADFKTFYTSGSGGYADYPAPKA